MSANPDLFGREHVDRYLATDGEEGYEWRSGTSILLLFTKGRKTGGERITPLIFRPAGEGAYTVIASKGGSPEAPGWLHNLEAEPEVEVQIKGDRFRARARVADEGERAELWERMTEVWPDYDAYQERTSRRIPLVVLERSVE